MDKNLKSKISESTFHIQFLKYTLEKGVALYSIDIICKEDESFLVSFKERYSILETFHDKFKKEASKIGNYPSFPEKKMFGNTDPEFLSKRLNSLQSYFSTIFKSKEFSNLKVVKDWIYEMFKVNYKPKEDKKVEQVIEKTPVEVKKQVVNNFTNDVEKPKINNLEEKKKKFDFTMIKCNEIADEFCDKFINLHEDNQIQVDEEEKREKKYMQAPKIIKSQMFDLPKGNNGNFDLLGMEDNGLCFGKKFLSDKLEEWYSKIEQKIVTDLNSSNIIIKIN